MVKTLEDRRRALLRRHKTSSTERIGIGGREKRECDMPKPVTKVNVKLRTLEEIEAAAKKC